MDNAIAHSVFLGIDVGWSESRRSCAFAVQGLHIPPGLWNVPLKTYSYGVAAHTIQLGLFRLPELLDFIRRLQRDFGSELKRAVAVIDGPIGPEGRPCNDRLVDSRCAAQTFNGRAQPSSISCSLEYVEATYKILDCFQAGTSTPPLWFGGELHQGLLLAETNPTVGLAMLRRGQRSDQLPSRRKPLLLKPEAPNPRGRLIRAKSDWYWAIGGRWTVSELLGWPRREDAIRQERHHERVAALYCLAVARQLAGNRVVALGSRAQGVYVIPEAVYPDWQTPDVMELVTHGQMQALDVINNPTELPAYDQVVSTATDAVTQEPSINERGDQQDLFLCDNGGVWEAHNPWLDEFWESNLPVELEPLDNLLPAAITLNRSQRVGQWRSNPSTSSIAAKRGFAHADLRWDPPDRTVIVPVRILATHLKP